MASVQDLIAAHEYKYGRPAIKSTLADTIIGIMGERQAAEADRQKEERIKQIDMDLLQKKFEYEQQQQLEKEAREEKERARQLALVKEYRDLQYQREEEQRRNRQLEEEKNLQVKQQMAIKLLQEEAAIEQKKEIEKAVRISQEKEREFNIYKQFKSMDDRTVSGDTKRFIEGGKSKELERKARVISREKITPKYDIVSGKASVIIEDKSPIEILQEEIAYGFYSTPQEIVKRGMELGADANKLEALATTAAIPGVMGSVQAQDVTPQRIPEGMKSKGYEYDKFGNLVSKGFEPITAQDKKAEQEMASAASAEQTKAETAKMNAESALNAIKIIRGDMSSFGVMGPVPAIGGTKKYEWAKNIDRVKSMLTLEKLNEMRRASASGSAGLGPLTDRDMQKLESAATDLDRGLSPKAADRALTDIEDIFNRVLQPKSQAQQQKQLPANDPLGLR